MQTKAFLLQLVSKLCSSRIQEDNKNIPSLISQVQEIFSKMKKVYELFVKLLQFERDKQIELEKNLEKPNIFLCIDDFTRLRRLNSLIKKLHQTQYRSFYLRMLIVIMKIQQTLNVFESCNKKYCKQHKTQCILIQNVIQKVNFISNAQIIADCEMKFSKERYLQDILKSDLQILICEQIKPVTKTVITILNQWLLSLKANFEQVQSVYFMIWYSLEIENFLNQVMQNISEPYRYGFISNLLKMKKLLKVKEFYLKNMNQAYISRDLLDTLTQLFQSLIAQVVDDKDQAKLFNYEIEKVTDQKESEQLIGKLRQGNYFFGLFSQGNVQTQEVYKKVLHQQIQT